MEYKKFIIDSSVIISFFNIGDSNYKKAQIFLNYFLKEQDMPDIIFYEVISVLKTKIKNRDILNKFIDYTTKSSQVTIRLYHENNRQFLNTFLEEETNNLSYVDSLLLNLSDTHHILTFDDNLKEAIQKRGGKLIS